MILKRNRFEPHINFKINLLYGNDMYSKETNNTAFSAVQAFTKPFPWMEIEAVSKVAFS